MKKSIMFLLLMSCMTAFFFLAREIFLYYPFKENILFDSMLSFVGLTGVTLTVSPLLFLTELLSNTQK